MSMGCVGQKHRCAMLFVNKTQQNPWIWVFDTHYLCLLVVKRCLHIPETWPTHTASVYQCICWSGETECNDLLKIHSNYHKRFCFEDQPNQQYLHQTSVNKIVLARAEHVYFISSSVANKLSSCQMLAMLHVFGDCDQLTSICHDHWPVCAQAPGA